MKKLSFIIILILFFGFLAAQPCQPEGITFTTQTQIDSFPINYPNCTKVGSILISGNDITNLDSLYSLTTITYDLEIKSNPRLKNIVGLSSLQDIGWLIDIQMNDSLFDLAGLDSVSATLEKVIISSNWSLTSLNGLNGIIECWMDFEIWHNPTLKEITALGNLEYVGDFNISGNNSLLSLVGLENLISIDGELIIDSNDSLIDLSGLENLETVNGDLTITRNNLLKTLDGLNNLITVAGSLEIGTFLTIPENPSLVNMNSLENLTTVGKNLRVCNNDSLTSLAGLNSLTSIGGVLEIKGNNLLTSLNGLDNINQSSIEELHIHHNDSLSVCEIESICGFLSEPNGTVIIYNNDEGCRNPPQIANACGFNISCLPFGDYYFTFQDEIDFFESDYPACLDLIGNVTIKGDYITGLNGLSAIESVEGDLLIWNLSQLTNLEGLENLNLIGGSLNILDNDVLNDLSALSNINIIGHALKLRNNGNLYNLHGLDNFGTDSLVYISIVGNSLLSGCDTKSICDYLSNPDPSTNIQNNASGCNSHEEVEEACLVLVSEVNQYQNVKTYPNPFTTSATIEYELKQPEFVTLSIFNHLSEQIEVIQEQQIAGMQQMVWYAGGLPAGMYYFRLQVGEQIANGKLMLVR